MDGINNKIFNEWLETNLQGHQIYKDDKIIDVVVTGFNSLETAMKDEL